MARKRLISPEFFTHPGLYDAEAASGLPIRVAFAGLWTASDRRGLFEWSPRTLKLAILPYDPCDFGAVLNTLEGAGFVQRYVVDGKEYGRVPSFKDWQSFHPHEKPSKAPEPPEESAEPTIVRPEPSKVGSDPTVSIAVTASSTASGAVAVTDTPTPEPEKQGEPDNGEIIPEEFKGDLELLLRSVRNPDAWAADIRAFRSGMRKPLYPSSQQMGQAIRDYNATDKSSYSPAHFRSFIERGLRSPKPRGGGNLAADKTVRALEIINIVKHKRVKGYLDQFNPTERRAIELVTPERIMHADPKQMGFIQTDLAKALSAGVRA